MYRLGSVEEKFRNDTEVRFEWRIKKIFSMLEHAEDNYSSHEVFFLDTEWCLTIYPKGYEDSTEEWIGLELEKSVAEPSALFTIGIKKEDGTEEIVLDEKLNEYQLSHVLKEFLRRSELLSRKSHLVPSDVLTITCRLWTDEPPPVQAEKMVSSETQRASVLHTGWRAAKIDHMDIKEMRSLRQHLTELLLDGDDHDVTFKVKGQEFKAHRIILRARSPVFAAMFKHDMKESTDNTIDIVDCRPETFGEFLRYVYTGKVENFSPSIALGLYYAGDKYNFSRLKEACVQFLKASLSTTAICDVIALAAKYGEEELHELATAFFTENLEEIMSTKEWQRFLAENLAYANEMCLKAMKSSKACKNCSCKSGSVSK